MNKTLELILSLSLGGTLMAALLFAIKPLVKNRVSRRFWYYLWLPVLLRLCLPVAGLLQPLSLPVAAPVADSVISAPAENTDNTAPALPGVTAPTGAGDTQSAAPAVSAGEKTAGKSWTDSLVKAAKSPEAWLYVWALGAVLSFGWNVKSYIVFRLKLRGSSAAPDEAVYTALKKLRFGKRRPGLSYCPLVSTPMLVGLLHPQIILPAKSYEKADMENILRHELSHYTRGDLYFKWFAMAVSCLHWFNPVAYLIRREVNRACEPACDEAVICAMAQRERRDYGNTLLNLAAAHKLPAGALATTMSEEKAKLKGRLINIMTYKKTTAAGVALSLVLTLLLCACGSAVGAVSGSREPASQAPAQQEQLAAEVSESGAELALTAEELEYFNTEFFNGLPEDAPEGAYLNIHNQFLASTYDKPEDIDLFSLFYCGTGGSQSGASQEERDMVVQRDGLDVDPDCDCQKNTTADMDAVLLENTGLTLAQTNGVSLDTFIYLEEYDAYYFFHGDTNYGNYIFDGGYRDGRGGVYLYYGNKVLYLKENTDGGYWFVSNTELPASDSPAVTPPDAEPAAPVASGTDISADYPVTVTKDDSFGVGVNLIYSDIDKIIFYGYFGLYQYDLNTGEITLAVDLAATVGRTNIQGSVGAMAYATADGAMVQLFSYEEEGLSETAYYINTADGSYTVEPYRELSQEDLDSTYLNENLGATGAFEFGENGTLAELTYTRDGQFWPVFENFFK